MATIAEHEITAALNELLTTSKPKAVKYPEEPNGQRRLFGGYEPDKTLEAFLQEYEGEFDPPATPLLRSSRFSLFDAVPSLSTIHVTRIKPADDSEVWADVIASGKTQAIKIDEEKATDPEVNAKRRKLARGRQLGRAIARSLSLLGEDTSEGVRPEKESGEQVNIADTIPPTIANELIEEENFAAFLDSAVVEDTRREYSDEELAGFVDRIIEEMYQETDATSIKNEQNKFAEALREKEKKKANKPEEKNPDVSTEKVTGLGAKIKYAAGKVVESLDRATQPVTDENKSELEIITDNILAEETEETRRTIKTAIRAVFQWFKTKGRTPPGKTLKEQIGSVLVVIAMGLPNGLSATLLNKSDAKKDNGARPPATAFGFVPSPTTADRQSGDPNVPAESVKSVEILAEIDDVKRNQLLVAKALKNEGILTRNVLAYSLATMKAESNFMPVREGWYLDVRDGVEPGTWGQRIAIENEYKGGKDKYGRGFIQLTHDYNYEWADKRLGLNGALVRNPDLALDPVIAARIFAVFVKDKGVAALAEDGKFVEARRPINGKDKAQTIAHDAGHYLEDPLLDDIIKTTNEVTGPYGSVVEWNQKIIDALVIGDGPHGGEYDDFPIELSSEGGTTTPRSRWWEGDYWCTYSIIDAYNLAGIPGLTPDNSEGVEKMRATFQSSPPLKYLEYLTGDHKTILQQVRPGYAIIMEEVLGSRNHNAHVGMVKKIDIDENGNGSIVSLESNANEKEKTYPVKKWQIQNTVESVVAFGGFETV